MNVGDVNDMRGQVAEKFCKYRTWQAAEKARSWKGSVSVKYSAMWRSTIP